jgi:hypothetical protein
MGTPVDPARTPADPTVDAGDTGRTKITLVTCPDAAVSTIHNAHHFPRIENNITMGRRDDRPRPMT